MKNLPLTQKDLPEELLWLCDIVGIDALIEIIDMAGGASFYVPKRQTLERANRDKAIFLECNGKNYKALGRKYGISENYVRKIVHYYQNTHEHIV